MAINVFPNIVRVASFGARDFRPEIVKVILIVLTLLSATSCASRKDIVFMNDIPDHDTLYAKVETQIQHKIQLRPGDQISINVSARNKELSEMFNRVSAQSDKGVNSYTIDEMGEIEFPFIGKIRIAGLDRMQTEEYIKSKIIESELIKEPFVSVEYTNLGFYKLGDWGGGFVPFQKDQTNILEAVALAGDIPVNSLRQNVLVIRRNQDGSENTYRVDFTSREKLYSSPAYFVQQNDIIYVEPNNKTLQQTTFNGTVLHNYMTYISLFSTALSIFLLVKNLK